MNLREKLVDFILGDFWKFLALAAVVVGAVHLTDLPWADFTNPPLWAKVGGVFAVVGLLAGYLAATLWYDPPEPDWQYVYEVNADDPATPRVSKVTPEVIDNMAVYGGRRLHSPQGRDSEYVCRHFNRDARAPVAHVTWKDIPSDADLLGTDAHTIEQKIVGMRDTYETTHGKYRWVLDHLYAVIRRIDFRRAQSQNAILDENLTPSMDDTSVSDHVDDIIPEDLRPDRLQGGDPDGDASSSTDAGDGDDVGDPDVSGAVDDVAPDGKSNLPAVADGGATDDE